MRNGALMEVKNVKKLYAYKRGLRDSIFGSRFFVRAVDDVSFHIEKAGILGLAGESGCGKTTIGRLLVHLERPTEGKIELNGADTVSLGGRELRSFRKATQMIFQDPYQAMNPRFTVYNIVSEPLIVHKIVTTKEESIEMATKMLERAGLKPAVKYLNRYPYELSGGEKQRVTIARAMILHPQFVVADEPVSMLDVTVRAGIMNLLLRLKKEFEIAYLFITHDLSVARYMCQEGRLAIMYLGKIFEIGPTEKIILDPLHPYTKLLLSAVPIPDPALSRRARASARGAISGPLDFPSGCRFHPRCPNAINKCKEIEPNLKIAGKDHYVACSCID